jgi:hypothetical protein
MMIGAPLLKQYDHWLSHIGFHGASKAQLIQSLRSDILEAWKEEIRKAGGSSDGEDKIDINLTGQIAATIAENLRQPWYSALTGVLGGIVASLATLAGIRITQKNETDRKKEQIC